MLADKTNRKNIVTAASYEPDAENGASYKLDAENGASYELDAQGNRVSLNSCHELFMHALF